MEFAVKVKQPRSIAQGDMMEVNAKIKHTISTGLGLNEDATEIYERFYRDKPGEYVSLVEVFYGEEQTNTVLLPNSQNSALPLGEKG